MPTDDPAPAHRLDARLTRDRLLGGKLTYIQPRDGLRATIDPVLLAAAVPARQGERVLEGGTGAGAALLCLAARVPGLYGLGVDRDPALPRLARMNAAENGFPGLMFAAGDLTASPVGGTFDHAFANPPYHAAAGSRSPSASREAAKRASPGLLAAWAAALARPLRERGTLTLILPPGSMEEALVAMRAAQAPASCVFPIRPRDDQPAGLVVVQGRKHGRTPLVLASGLTLHTESGAFRAEAESVFRDGAALRLPGR